MLTSSRLQCTVAVKEFDFRPIYTSCPHASLNIFAVPLPVKLRNTCDSCEYRIRCVGDTRVTVSVQRVSCAIPNAHILTRRSTHAGTKNSATMYGDVAFGGDVTGAVDRGGCDGDDGGEGGDGGDAIASV